jgi:hypothetical protein
MPAEPVKPSPNPPEAGAAKGSTKSESAKRKPMPFEPQTKATSSQAKAKQGKRPAAAPGTQPTKATQQAKKRASSANREGGIPDFVSRRMIKRIAWCSGVPTLLGMSTFVASYLAVSNGLPLPTYAVLLVSLGWFGLGVLGVSYGVLSASWDEDAGSLIGWNELQTNWARLTSEWKANSEAARANRAKSKKS